MIRVSYEELHSFVVAALQSTNMSSAASSTVADALVTTDAMGVVTHGTKLLHGYMRKLQGGGYNPVAMPVVEREGKAWAVVDGNSALGQIGCDFAVRFAMRKARDTGVAYVGLRNTGHIGAAGYFASVAAREGFLAMVTGNDIPSVAAPGSRKAVLGSNPLAYAVPVANGDPILLDMATAAVAGGKVYAALQRGEAISNTWLIGPDGNPTNDGALYPAQASLAPMAGHKGYGLGLWCEILSGVLPCGNITWQIGSWIFDEPARPSWHNASFIVIDIEAIAPRKQFDQRLNTLIAEIHAAPTAAGVDRVLLPGEREWNNLRLARQLGLGLPADVIEKLHRVAQASGVRPAWLTAEATARREANA